jgi:outer membrane protein
MKRAGLKAAALLCAVLTASSVFAAGGKPYAKEGFYFGVILPYNTVDGDFDGETAYQNVPGSPVEEMLLVNDLDGGLGWGAALGYRLPRLAMELNYLRSKHDQSFGGFDMGEAELQTLNLDLKYFFLHDKPVQPYLLAGVGYYWLTEEDSAFSPDVIAPTKVDDATFSNFGLNGGGGVAIYISPRVAVNGGVIFRWTQFTDVQGINEWSLKRDLDFTSLTYSVGLTYTLGTPARREAY